MTLVLHHEPWRDEADTWLAARDLTPAGLWRFAGYVGSPLLWYWLQMPLAKLGAPYASLGILNALFAAVGVGLFLWRAPFPWWVRLLFAFSYFGSYEYAVIARSYALSMALLFVLAALDRVRFARPILYGAALALSINTSVHGVIVGSAILATFAWDALRGLRGDPPMSKARAFAGLAIGVFGWVLAIVQLAPPSDGQLQGIDPMPDWSKIATTLAGALFPTAEASPLALVAAPILWLAALIAIARTPRAGFVMLASSAGLWLLFVLKYTGQLRHWGFLLLVMLYALWIARIARSPHSEPAQSFRRRNLALDAGLGLAFAWSVFVASDHWRRDVRDPFSASKAVARFLEVSGLTGVPIAAWPAPHAEAVLPYLPGVRFWYPGIRDDGTHMRWSREDVAGFEISDDEALRRVNERFPRGDVVLLVNRPLRSASVAGFRPVHAEIGDVMMGDEQYFVYRR